MQSLNLYIHPSSFRQLYAKRKVVFVVVVVVSFLFCLFVCFLLFSFCLVFVFVTVSSITYAVDFTREKKKF